MSDKSFVKKTDIALYSDVDIDALIHRSIIAMLGDENLYNISTEDSNYDYTYSNPKNIYNHNNPPIILLKALHHYMKSNSLTYDDLIKLSVKAFNSTLDSYNFLNTGEVLQEDEKNGLLELSYGNYQDLKLDRLIRSGVSGLKRWRIVAGDFKSIQDVVLPYNFFTAIYSELFNVDQLTREHIIDTLPDINYPAVTLEAYIYLRSLRTPETHFDKTCKQAIDKYNRNLKIDPENDFVLQTYPINQGSEVDDILDKKAKIHEPYDIMLMLFLCFPASCNNDEIIWDALPYYDLYALMKAILSFHRDDNTLIIGRIVSEDFYKDMRKAVFLKIQSTAIKTDTAEITSSVFTGMDIVKPNQYEIFTAVNKEIVNFMSSGLPSDLWFSSSELPASWIALL